MTNLVFKKYNGEIINDVNQYVKNWMDKYPYGEIYIGCDSQEHAKHIVYAVVIVMHRFTESLKDNPNRTGKGAHVLKAIIKTKENMTPKNNFTYDKNGKRTFNTGILATKLWKEVEYTIEAAKMLDIDHEKIKIHIDYNSKEDAGSHMLYASGLGYAQGMGYQAEAKPYAWAASHIADAYVR
jgi:predicted RNase H-related nuclease YkuK (DUF458 family)